MNNLLTQIIKNKYFFLLFGLFFFFGLWINIVYSQTEIFLECNKYHNSFFDSFFKVFTRVGDGIVFVVVAFFLILKSVRKAILLSLAGCLVAAIVQFMKRVLFEDHFRPIKNLEHLVSIYKVPGYPEYLNNSFPSGHSATTFCIITLMLFLLKGKWLQLPFFIIALLAIYSRIYLAQHYFIDIWVGASIGVLIACIIYLIGDLHFFQKLPNKPLFSK